MSIKLKDTIYDLTNKADKDSQGNVIVNKYVTLDTEQNIVADKIFKEGIAIQDGKSIHTVSGTGILGIYSTTWTGLPKDGSAIGVGSVSNPLYLRSSGDNLYHYRQDLGESSKDNPCVILDSKNYTNYFKDYISSVTPRAPHTVLIGPVSGTTNAAPTFRVLAKADLPVLGISDITNLKDTLDNKAEKDHLHDERYLKLILLVHLFLKFILEGQVILIIKHLYRLVLLLQENTLYFIYQVMQVLH